MIQRHFVAAAALSLGITALANVTVGSASYLDRFPGYDSAGRNSYPSGNPYLSGDVADKPVPTNDWWSAEVANPHATSIFNYPLALKPLDNGLAIIKNIQRQAIVDVNPLLVGLEGLNASSTTVCNYSDWGVTLRWAGSGSSMEAIVCMGVPMVYFTRTAGTANVRIALLSGEVTVDGNVAVVTGCYNQASYALYAPTGCTWQADGLTLTLNLGSKDYWTAAMLPDNTTDAMAKAKQWAKFAFAFPTDTKAEYSVNGGQVATDYKVTPTLKEPGAHTLMGVLPHQYNHAVAGQEFTGDYYNTVRGTMKMFDGEDYKTELTFKGIIPALPGAQTAESGYSLAELKTLVNNVCEDNGFADWTDSYNDGQLLNRLTVTARVAYESGDTEGFNKAFALVKSQLEKWMTAKDGDVAFVFYYHKPWSTMLGYPAGHSQDSNINDHNFHWGYFINAASLVAEHDANWLSQWGGMVDLLVRDVACIDRNDSMFPYLRSFSPYAGHCWANGLASLSLGNDEESTSEAMMCHAAIMQWAALRGDNALLDACVWMYATELSAIQSYWFDTRGEVLPSDFQSALASRVFGNSYDDENFWGGGIAGSYGIQIYPVQASSTYLVDDKAYAAKLWNAMCNQTGILSGENNPNIWYDAWTQFLAMISPADALNFYKTAPNLGEKFGASQAMTYQWIHALAALGTPDPKVWGDYPFSTTFRNGNVETYAVYNYTNQAKTVTFSDGFTMVAAANKLTTATGTAPDDGDDDPGIVTPGGGDQGGGSGDTGEATDACITVDREASEGTFNGDYTISCSTSGNNVTITAKFDGTYDGFAGPWFFNQTNGGFQEMSMTETSAGVYSITLTNQQVGSLVEFRVKIAFAGGLAVTKLLDYEVGKSCASSLVDAVELLELAVSPNPAHDFVDVTLGEAADAVISVFNASGRCLLNQSVSRSTGNSVVRLNVAGWASGVYFVTVQKANQGAVRRLIKL
jgi:endoglucanase Acf2